MLKIWNKYVKNNTCIPHEQNTEIAKWPNSQNVPNTIYYIAEGNPIKGSIYKASIRTILGNSRQGVLTDKFIALSPTTVLNHEVDHALRHNNDPKGHWKDSNTKNKEYRTEEERRVITGSEQLTAKVPGEIKEGEVTRTNIKGILFTTENSVSNKDVNETTVKPTKSKKKDENDIDN